MAATESPIVVLDASFCLPWFYEDEATPAVLALRDQVLEQSQDILVPAIWPLEMLNSFGVAYRRKRITAAQRDGYTAILGQLLQITVCPVSPADYEPIQALAQKYKLSAYDAAYLYLALSQLACLATFDETLRTAATQESVPLLPAKPLKKS